MVNVDVCGGGGDRMRAVTEKLTERHRPIENGNEELVHCLLDWLTGLMHGWMDR